MTKAYITLKSNNDEYIFLPGHPEADAKGFIHISNRNLLTEMASYIIEAKKNFHETELKNKRKARTPKF